MCTLLSLEKILTSFTALFHLLLAGVTTVLALLLLFLPHVQCKIAHLSKFCLTFYGPSIRPFYNAITEVKWLFITTMISPANDILNSRKEATACRGVKVHFVHRLAESWYWWQNFFLSFLWLYDLSLLLCFLSLDPVCIFLQNSRLRLVMNHFGPHKKASISSLIMLIEPGVVGGEN